MSLGIAINRAPPRPHEVGIRRLYHDLANLFDLLAYDAQDRNDREQWTGYTRSADLQWRAYHGLGSPTETP